MGTPSQRPGSLSNSKSPSVAAPSPRRRSRNDPAGGRDAPPVFAGGAPATTTPTAVLLTTSLDPILRGDFAHDGPLFHAFKRPPQPVLRHLPNWFFLPVSKKRALGSFATSVDHSEEEEEDLVKVLKEEAHQEPPSWFQTNVVEALRKHGLLLSNSVGEVGAPVALRQVLRAGKREWEFEGHAYAVGLWSAKTGGIFPPGKAKDGTPVMGQSPSPVDETSGGIVASNGTSTTTDFFPHASAGGDREQPVTPAKSLDSVLPGEEEDDGPLPACPLFGTREAPRSKETTTFRISPSYRVPSEEDLFGRPTRWLLFDHQDRLQAEGHPREDGRVYFDVWYRWVVVSQETNVDVELEVRGFLYSFTVFYMRICICI